MKPEHTRKSKDFREVAGRNPQPLKDKIYGCNELGKKGTFGHVVVKYQDVMSAVEWLKNELIGYVLIKEQDFKTRYDCINSYKKVIDLIDEAFEGMMKNESKDNQDL